MIRMAIPNEHGVSVESGPASKGPGYAVVATRWSVDQTAQIDKRWVRFDSETEADTEAERLRGSNWGGILSWFTAS